MMNGLSDGGISINAEPAQKFNRPETLVDRVPSLLLGRDSALARELF
jgi:hypothetical protein